VASFFDVGHGGGSFVFNQAVPAVQQGFLPDSISTDLHIASMNAGMKDMLNVMSKFLNLGMPLEDVVLRSTWNPAKEIRHEELGHLSVGAPADISVLRLEKGNFGFVDSLGGRLEGHQKLACELTVQNGLIVWDLNGIAREDWQIKNGLHSPSRMGWHPPPQAVESPESVRAIHGEIFVAAAPARGPQCCSVERSDVVMGDGQTI